ncbi:MAG: hypothetical protein RLY47_81 [Candidatus Parcubacteria bacterium]|jgi:uncharacterized membrane protein
MNDQKPRTTPKDFFIYLGTAISLYVSAGSLLSLLFSIINERFVDALDMSGYYYGGYGYSGTGATFAIASLIVVVPIYLILSYYIRKGILKDDEKRNLSIRKWFVWFTLFAAGIAVAGDLVTLLYTFLQGEITMRFILKVLAVFVVAGGIFSYYFYDLRRDVSAKPNKLFVSLAGLFVLLAIVLGFMTFGSPNAQREMRLDSQREMNLSDIQWQVLNHWQTQEKLPAALTDLNDEFGGYTAPVDPETKASYEYNITGPLSFELCATFDRASSAKSQGEKMMPVDSYGGGLDPRFQHEAGRTCFARTIDPVKYPPFNESKPMY